MAKKSSKGPEGIDPREVRTMADKHREYVSRQIARVVGELTKERDHLAYLRGEYDQAKEDLGNQSKLIESLNTQIRELALDLGRIDTGNYTPPLFDRQTGETLAPAGSPKEERTEALAGDVALSDFHLLDVLKEFGVTEFMLEKLRQSQLAKELPLKTIGDLKKAIASDEWWHKKVKGFGGAKVDLLTDALVKHAEKNRDDDPRPKMCHFCSVAFEENKCPKCGNSQYFAMADEEAQQPDASEEPSENAADTDGTADGADEGSSSSGDE